MAPLAFPQFRNLWLGLIIVNVGGQMRQLAMGWLLIQLAIRDGDPTRGPFYIGLLGFATFVPGLVSGLFAGVIADRMDRRKLLLMTQLGAAVVVAVLATRTISGGITIAEVIGAAALSTVFQAFDAPVRWALLPRLVPVLVLPSAGALISMVTTLSILTGPLIGGLLIEPIGVGGLMLLNAASYAGVILALVLLPAMPPSPGSNAGSLVASLREGIAFCWSDAVLRPVLGLITIMMLLGRPYLIVLPAVAHDVLHVGPQELSWLLGAAGFGAFIGSFGSSALARSGRPALVICLSTLAVGALVVGFGAQRSLAGALVLSAAVQVPLVIAWVMSISVIQIRTPDHLRGRVLALQTITGQFFQPLGVGIIGTAGTLLGIDVAIMLAGVGVAATAGIILVRVKGIIRLRDIEAGAE